MKNTTTKYACEPGYDEHELKRFYILYPYFFMIFDFKAILKDMQLSKQMSLIVNVMWLSFNAWCKSKSFKIQKLFNMNG